MSAAPIYEFGDVRVDLGRMAVSRGDQAVDLEPKALDVLRFLIEHRDRLVTKGELLDAVWRDTFVTPNVLTRVVAQLRKAIGDDAHGSRYIETASKRGYRFIAPVTSDRDAVAAPAPAAEPIAAAPAQAVSRRGVSWRWMAAVLVLVIVVAGVVIALRSARGDVAAPTTSFPAVKRIVGGSGYSVEPTLSPDGRAIAYSSDKSGGLEIYVTSLMPGGRELAVTADGGQNMQPAWSPDGQWIAFHSRGRGGVWIVPAMGGVARQVVEFGSSPAWSPDSRSLAFASDEGTLAAEGSIWIIRPDGGDRRQLTRAGSPQGGHQMPAWSHDGRYIAFANLNGGATSELWVVRVNDGALTKLPGGPIGAGRVGGNPQFAPDDRAIYFSGFTPDGNGRIFKVPIDPDTADAVGAPQPVLAYDDALSAGLTVGRGGTTTYALYDEDSNLWAVNWPGAGAPIRLTDGKRNFRASYSRNGHVVYMNQEVGQGFTIWLMAEDGSQREPLAPGLQGFSPQWSADGMRVLVRKSGDFNDTSFLWVDANTRRATPVSFGVDRMGEVRLSPKDDEMVYHVIGDNGVLNLWTQSLDGRMRRQITFEREAISYPTWSPDGRSIAAEMKRGNDTFVVVVPAGGGKAEQLTYDHGQSWPNAWSPDGEWIAFAGERGGVWNLWVVSTHTRETRQLTRFTSPAGYVRWPTWSPDGHRIIFERNQVRAGIWLTQLP